MVATICCTLRFFVTSLLFSIAEEGFRFQLIPRKVRKIVPHFTIFLNTSSSLRRKADAKLVALVSHWRRSFTRIESCNRVDILTSHLTHNACFNIVPFKHLLSSTGYLHHSALKPHVTHTKLQRRTTRSATLRNAGEILVQTDHKVSSMPHE